MLNNKEALIFPKILEVNKGGAQRHLYKISIGALIEELYARRLGQPIFPLKVLNMLKLSFQGKAKLEAKNSNVSETSNNIESLLNQSLSEQLTKGIHNGEFGPQVKELYEKANSKEPVKICVIDMKIEDFFSNRTIGTPENQKQREDFLADYKLTDGSYAQFGAMHSADKIYVFKESIEDEVGLGLILGHELAHAAYEISSFGQYSPVIAELAPIAWGFSEWCYNDVKANIRLISIFFGYEILETVKNSIDLEIPEEHIVTKLSENLGNRATMLFLYQIPEGTYRHEYHKTIAKNFNFDSLNKYYLKLAYQELGEEGVDKNIRKYLDSKLEDFELRYKTVDGSYMVGFYEYIHHETNFFKMKGIPQIYLDKILVVTKEHYTDDGKSKVTVPDRTKKDGPLFNGPIKNSELKKLSKQMPTVTRFKEYCANLISIHFILLEKLVLKFVS